MILNKPISTLVVCALVSTPIHMLHAEVAVTTAQPETKIQNVTPPEIAAKSYLIEDVQSGQVLFSFDEEKRIEPASLAKLMTTYLTFVALKEGTLKPDQLLTVSRKGYEQEGSRMFLDPRKAAPVEDVVKGMIVQSGNDASVTLAEAIAGSEEAFVVMMNDRAQRLGMHKTHYTNSTGLPDPNLYTTVEDLAILSRALIADFPEYYSYFGLKTFTYNNIIQPNRNTLLFKNSSVDGLKTGHTESAGYNLISSAQRNGRRVLSIVVGTKNMKMREETSSKLLDWALQFFETPKLYDAEEKVSTIKVYKGKENELSVGFLQPVYATVPLGKSKEIVPTLETYQPVVAPVKKGQQVGVLKVSHQDKLLYEIPVVALEEVKEAGFFGRTWDGMVLWFKSF